MRTRLVLISLGALTLAGCQHNNPQRVDSFGEANRQTFAAQIIDPMPVYDNPVPETYADHAGQAVDRYRRDRVKLPDRVKTTDAGVAEASRDAK